MDQSVPNSQQGQAPQQAFQPTSAPSKEKGIVGAPKGKFGRLKRETRLSQSEGQSSGAEDERFGTSLESKSPYGQSPVLQGMHAKNSHYRNGHLSSSPRSPNTRGHFQARRTRGQQLDEGHSVPTVKASGIPHRQSSRGRNRTSSETEQGGQGSRGPYRRRRGFSEAENGSVWEKVSVWRVVWFGLFFFSFFLFAPPFFPPKSLSALWFGLFVFIYCIALDHERSFWGACLTTFASHSLHVELAFIPLGSNLGRQKGGQHRVELHSALAPVQHHKVRLTRHLVLVDYFINDYFLSWLDQKMFGLSCYCARVWWLESMFKKRSYHRVVLPWRGLLSG